MNISTKLYKRTEIVLKSNKIYENPFMDVEIDAIFTHEDGTVITLPGFWNGENEWKVRFAAEKVGKWTYSVTCTDKDNASLTDTGVIEAEAIEPKNMLEKHGYVRLEKGKKHMVYNDGTPFFYLGDTHWMMPDHERLHECNYPGCTCGNQFKHIADDRIKKGFTVYQTYFASQRVKPAASGVEGWWTDDTFTVINPKPFNDTMDVMMDYLADNGITISLGFGTHYASVKVYKQNVTVMKAFARYCVARYACYPLIWITAQEITNYNENAFDCWKQVGAYVGKLDGYHRPNGAHMHCHTYEEKRSQELDQEPWHQWWTVQAGHGGYDRLRRRSYYQGYYYDDKMFIETESQYEDIYCSGFCGHDAPRMSAWQALQLGSGGFTYGVTGIWVAGWHQKYSPAQLSYSPESWFTGVDKDGSMQVSYMKKFYEYVKWYELEPCYDFKFGNFDDRRHISISHKGNDVVIYYFFCNDVDMGIFTDLKPNTAYKARLFDPICGKFIDIPDLVTNADGTASIPAFPIQRDWVLLINVKEIDFGPYESYEFPTMLPPIPASAAVIDKELEIVSIKASSEDEDFPATNLIDGNPDTYWQGFAKKTSQTIIADLGTTQHFDYLNINCPDTQRFIQFRIFGSNDGENYDLICERPSGQVAVGGKYDTYFDPVSGDYRFIKFFLNSDYTQEAPVKFSKFALFTKKND